MLLMMVVYLSQTHQTVSCISHFAAHFMAFIPRQGDFLFLSIPEGNGLTLALVIVSVLFLVVMGIAAVFVYRRWKKKRTKSGCNTPDEEIPMNPVTVQPVETVS